MKNVNQRIVSRNFDYWNLRRLEKESYRHCVFIILMMVIVTLLSLKYVWLSFVYFKRVYCFYFYPLMFNFFGPFSPFIWTPLPNWFFLKILGLWWPYSLPLPGADLDGSKLLSPRCMIRVNLRKAYNSFEWEFLERMMRELGFISMLTCKMGDGLYY